MTRILIALVVTLALASGASFAEDTKNPPPAATQPATPDAKSGEAAGGCMPGGGCCGSAACKEASKASADAPMPAGCPCQRRKAAAAAQSAQ
jgi:hypothetical protein